MSQKNENVSYAQISDKLQMMIDGCSITLIFPPETQGSVVEDVKRMIVSGYTQMQSRADK